MPPAAGPTRARHPGASGVAAESLLARMPGAIVDRHMTGPGSFGTPLAAIRAFALGSIAGARTRVPRAHGSALPQPAHTHGGLAPLLAARARALACPPPKGTRTPDFEHAVGEVVAIVGAAIRRAVPYVTVDALLHGAAARAQFDGAALAAPSW